MTAEEERETEVGPIRMIAIGAILTAKLSNGRDIDAYDIVMEADEIADEIIDELTKLLINKTHY